MKKLKPITITDTDSHTMGNSLRRYLSIKIHPLIETEQYNKIKVIGSYDRTAIISCKEKKGKLHNYYRPTATLHKNTLFIKCFPGYDYIYHYTNIIKSHLALNNKNPSIVSWELPSDQQCQAPLTLIKHNLSKKSDTIIIGTLTQLFKDATWTESDTSFSSTYIINTTPVDLLMVKHSFWGDIGGRLITILADEGYKKVIFIGKLGSLCSDYQPNIFLASGNKSYINGKFVTWKNIFSKCTADNLIKGIHITVPSVLTETKMWLKKNINKFDFVDPEIGHMAMSANKSGIGFSYLHIISDNVCKKYEEDLSNERRISVINKRLKLNNDIRHILFTTFN